MKSKKGAYRHAFTISDFEITKRALSPFDFTPLAPLQKTSLFLTKGSCLVSARHCFADISTIAIVSLWVGYYWAQHNEARISMSISFWGDLITFPTSQWISLWEKCGFTQPLKEKERHRKVVSDRTKNMAIGS